MVNNKRFKKVFAGIMAASLLLGTGIISQAEELGKTTASNEVIVEENDNVQVLVGSNARGSQVPTQSWSLYEPGDHVGASNAKHEGQYQYQAYLNRNHLYSNYWFIPMSYNRWRFYGVSMYSDQTLPYYARMYNKNTGKYCTRYISSGTNGFDMWHYQFNFDGGMSLYFELDSRSTGSAISLIGFVDTY